ncbi:MAG: hypothetical protein KC438_11230, partial [Thermomicrobiales bacterium]|nr:hypothetical protein [Thermomicrobiales bacterium]
MVKWNQTVGEALGEVVWSRVFPEQNVEHAVRGHAAHEGGPFERFAGGIDPVGRYGDDPEVDIGGQPAVESNLVFAGLFAFGGIAKINKTQIDRSLQLDDLVAGQQHPGDMGFDQAHLIHRPRIGGGIEQLLDVEWG